MKRVERELSAKERDLRQREKEIKKREQDLEKQFKVVVRKHICLENKLSYMIIYF